MIKIDKKSLKISIVQGDTGAFTVGIKNYKLTEAILMKIMGQFFVIIEILWHDFILL